MTDDTTPVTPADIAARAGAKKFSAVEVDQIVRAKVQEAAAEYQREQRRRDIAERHGLSASDRDTFLTPDTEDKWEAKAARLVELGFTKRPTRGPIAPKEGGTVQTGKALDFETQEFVDELFGRDPFWM